MCKLHLNVQRQVGFTTYFDQRFKTNVQTNVKGLDFILKLRPVTYNVNAPALDKFLHQGNTPREKDETGDQLNRQALQQKANITYTGFLAQEVEKAAKAAGFDFSGVDAPKNDHDLYGLRYAEFVVPLVKAVQEQQEMIKELKKEITQRKRKLTAINSLQPCLELQTAFFFFGYTAKTTQFCKTKKEKVAFNCCFCNFIVANYPKL